MEVTINILDCCACLLSLARRKGEKTLERSRKAALLRSIVLDVCMLQMLTDSSLLDMNNLVGGDARQGVTLSQLVLEATDELLNEPDYSKTLDIVERIQVRTGEKTKRKEKAKTQLLFSAGVWAPGRSWSMHRSG